MGQATRQNTDAPPQVTDGLNLDQLPAGGGNGAEGSSTVVEEDLEDWVNDFDDISLNDMSFGVKGVGRDMGKAG